ncbi:MAG: MFS transporter [Deltaproteobacteria bacterium]|nr:MFS transporter [Deltaproteobacteria bacterium]MBW2500479.1 MFS transporter [Deltaproteobacteria bacterium]
MDTTSRPKEPKRVRSDLSAMLGDGVAFSFMVGIGESFVAPFALALGFGDVTAGLIATAPMLAGALLQLVTPAAVHWLGSHKRWVVLCAALQAVSFLPLVAGALAGAMAVELLYLAVSLYWGLGMATSPAWNTWAETLVPRRLRPRYFAQRARWSQAALLVGLAAGGLALHVEAPLGEPVGAYALVFGAALVARVVSARFLGLQSEPQPVPLGETRISPRAIRQHVQSGGHGRLLAYLLVFQSSVWIAAPYFTPYMLGPLGLDYATFAALTASAFLARILALPALGRAAHRSGTRRVLWLGSVGIVPLPALWLISDSLPWLFFLQLLGGFSWAAFELATLLSFFEHIPPHSRTSVLSVYNLAYAAAIVAGSAIGGAILALWSQCWSAYAALMVVSTLARFASLATLRGTPDVVPPIEQPPALRTLTVRPSAGALQRPVLPTLPDDDAGARAEDPDTER